VSDAADTCGDIDAVHSPLAGVSFGTMTVACSDLDGDGKLEISSCTSWRQPGKNETCDGTGASDSGRRWYGDVYD